MKNNLVNIIHLSHKNPQSPYWDRGFLYGESIYDVMPFYDKKPFKSKEHFQRFHRDLTLMKMDIHISYEKFLQHVCHAIEGADYPDGAVYIQVTSGHYGTRTAMPPNQEVPTIVFLTFEYKRPTMLKLMGGIKLILYPESRGPYCHVKSTNRLPSRLAQLKAKELGASEAIWYDTQTGHIHEGCSSNIFFIQENQLITPELSPYIFQGLAREQIIRLADTLNISVITRKIHQNELHFFQGAFITGSIKQLLPVRQIDQHYYTIHPLWGTLFKAYNHHIDTDLDIQRPQEI